MRKSPFERFAEWFTAQQQEYVLQLAAKQKGTQTGITYCNREGKIVDRDPELTINDIKDFATSLLRDVGVEFINLEVRVDPFNPRIPGHSNVQITFDIKEVPPTFRDTDDEGARAE